jgi:cold shock CspA family protein/tetratricopeptide (TPR) repeat protein
VDVPDFLKTQVREGKVVLVFGAGASRGAVGPDGAEPPDGNKLARLIADRFLGGKFSSASLSQVSEYAISESSLVDVQEFVRSIFESFEPATFHRLIPKFRWHGLATTNYDRIIEKAYQVERDRVQVLQPIISNGDRLQDALRSPDNVLLLKVHGCISRTADADCPLILTTDQYVQYKSGRSRLFATLQEWAYDRPLVFVGHSIQDPDLRAILLELTALGEKRARCFGVVPDADDVAARYWEAKKLTLLNGTCQQFLETLDAEIPTNTRVLAGLLRAQESHPIAERFRATGTVLSDTCRSFLTNDVEYVRSATSPRIDPRHFYRGLSPGWSSIEQNLDARRKLADTVLSDVVLAEPGDHPDAVEVVLIKGHAGSGKSVLLRRIAWDAAHDYNAVALFMQPQGALVTSAIRELLAAIDDRLYLFVDDAVDRTREITALVREVGSEGKRLTVFLAERINEWNVGGGSVDPYLAEQYTIPYLELAEINSLLELLTRHRALGTLEGATPEERVAAFEQRAGRQLLVALHEATLGRPFEDIIKDEYDNIVPAEAQEMYLSICVLNRLNVPVRAGLIARMHDIPFHYFEQRFFRPLEHVVQTSYDPVLRDHTYAARHPQIAEIVFQGVLIDTERRLDKYLRCLQTLNIDYSTDERAFRQMVRGRTVLELFPSTEMAQHVFRTARETVGQEPHLLQQMALYEMNRSNGSLERAAEFLDEAAATAPYDLSIKHSKAELLLRLADIARTPLEREQRLREAMRIAGSLRDERPGRQDGSHAFHTIVKVGLRRLEDVLQDGAAVSEEAVTSAIKSVEDSLLDGLQRFPDDPYLLTSEAQLATLLRDSARAITAMRSAFKTNPRNSVIAVRLAKSLEALGDASAAKATIQTGLENTPGDKRLHYTLAKFLMRHEPQAADQIEYHLQRSFTTGDANYDAQLLYARQLYARGDVDGAKQRFRLLASAKVGPDVRDRMRYPLEGWFSGGVVRLEATYGFVARDGIGDWVFMHRSEVNAGDWTTLRMGSRVRFQIAFTMKGQTAKNLVPEIAAS